MGNFSWMDCKNSRKNIKNYRQQNVYVLVPEKFQNFFGKRIVEPYYDGYGHFDCYDIYELVTEWNKEELSEDMLEKAPQLKQFGGLRDFEKDKLRKEGKSKEEIEKADNAERERFYNMAINRRNRTISCMNDFKNNVPELVMAKKYGREWKRELGISIACYDEQNFKLPYPIKITYDDQAVYEKCKPSKSDENQGF